MLVICCEKFKLYVKVTPKSLIEDTFSIMSLPIEYEKSMLLARSKEKFTWKHLETLRTIRQFKHQDNMEFKSDCSAWQSSILSISRKILASSAKRRQWAWFKASGWSLISLLINRFWYRSFAWLSNWLSKTLQYENTVWKTYIKFNS